MARLKREFATPGTDTMIACPFQMPDSFIGWYAVRKNENTIVYGYTGYRKRRSRVATEALSRMGLALNSALLIRFWTPACARLACKPKWNLVFDTRDAFDA
jgi:hypothetical protein